MYYGEVRNACKICLENLEGRGQFGDLNVDGSMLQKVLGGANLLLCLIWHGVVCVVWWEEQQVHLNVCIYKMIS
jgi:hypothetical protein